MIVEIGTIDDGSMDFAKLILDTFDYCTLMVFVLEILLKWLDNFWIFWKNGWNVFDFLVTFPVRIRAFYGGNYFNTDKIILGKMGMHSIVELVC